MSNFVSAEELKKRKASAEKAKRDQEAAEETAQEVRAQVEYEKRLPILTAELRPYIRAIFARVIDLAMELKWGSESSLATDPKKLVVAESPVTFNEQYGGSYKTKIGYGMPGKYWVHLTLDMSSLSAENSPWGYEPAAVGAWSTVTAELMTELEPLGYLISFKYIPQFEHQIGGEDMSPSTYYTGPGCEIELAW
jgi:hypothetical protein